MTQIITEHFADNRDGWKLGLRHAYDPSRLDPSRRPILIVPGYGMNNFIFSYHPHGTSMEHTFVEAGFEVFSANLRKQGSSRAISNQPTAASLDAFVNVDVPTVVQLALEKSQSRADKLDLLGASLGGTIGYAYLALHPDAPVESLIAVGSPLRWASVHPVLRGAFFSSRVVGLVKMRGTRLAARAALPLLTRVPALLNLYMNPANVDLTKAERLVQTVENPDSNVNRDLAKWLKQKDLIIRGQNITTRLADVDKRLLLVLANRDGIVPESSATSAADAWGGSVDTLRVGTDENWYAHADLFVGNEAPNTVFEPMMQWLKRG